MSRTLYNPRRHDPRPQDRHCYRQRPQLRARRRRPARRGRRPHYQQRDPPLQGLRHPACHRSQSQRRLMRSTAARRDNTHCVFAASTRGTGSRAVEGSTADTGHRDPHATPDGREHRRSSRGAGNGWAQLQRQDHPGGPYPRCSAGIGCRAHRRHRLVPLPIRLGGPASRWHLDAGPRRRGSGLPAAVLA